MKKISIAIMVLVLALASCKKTPEVNLKYVDVERDLITVGTTTATVQCDYDYIATLKKAYFYYGEGTNEADMNKAEMRVVQNTLYVDLTGLRANATYSYFYEFHNGFNSMRTALKTFKTEGGSDPTIILPTVVTGEVTEITISSAKGSGEVTNDGGTEVTERGICWSTNENPTLNDNHVAAGTGIGAFTAIMSGLEANTTYHVRAYATNEAGTAYGLDREFVTVGGGGCDCGYVDLGLPSGTLWSTCNVGANSPEEYGDYFAWGETEPKSVYEWSNYKYCNGDQYQLTKYCNNSLWGYNGFTDTLTILQSIDDAATANWGDEWCMPTREQWKELYDNTSSIWTTLNDIDGRLFIASNGNSLFFPASFMVEAKDNDRMGMYWSRTCSDRPDNGMYVCLVEGQLSDTVTGMLRSFGCSVRPVRKTDTPTPPGNVPEGAINGLFTINENGDQVYFSQGNLQYQASTNTWRFAENQWNQVGGNYSSSGGGECGNVYENGVKCDNMLVSATYSGWIDLFCWGTSGWDCGNVYYHPYDKDGEGEQYGPLGYSSLTGEYANSDWGVYNPIINGGNQSGLWRTMTLSEWYYVMSYRAQASEKLSMAQVNGVHGCVILPDEWDCPTGLSFVPQSFDWITNVYTEQQWKQMELKGAVFLPASGERNSIGLLSYDRCEYHTANASSDWSCWHFIIDISGFVGDTGYTRVLAPSVRLVQDAH